MTKYRTHGGDVMSRNDQTRSSRGASATASSACTTAKAACVVRWDRWRRRAHAARFHGQLGSKLGRGPDGKRAWLAPKEPNKQQAWTSDTTTTQARGTGPASTGERKQQMTKISHLSHGDADPRRQKPVAFHPGMTDAQTNAAKIGGMGHPVTGSTPGAAPLTHAYSTRPDMKRGRAVPVHPSMSRGAQGDDAMKQLGDAILREGMLRTIRKQQTNK